MMRFIISLTMVCGLTLGFASQGRAEIRLDLDAMSVIGNAELPRVVYIAAWRKAPKGDLLQQSLESLHSNEPVAIDRDVFRRQIDYYDMLNKLPVSE